jgi:hypothetical protein
VEYCPIDTGNLRRSHYVTEPVITGSNVVVEFGCGGTAESYAIEQHENLAFGHKQDLTGTSQIGAKFLERAMNEESGSAAQNMIATARAAFEEGKGYTRAPGLEGNPAMPFDPSDHEVR